MRVESPEVETTASGIRLSATIRGHVLFWETASTSAFELRGEPFIAALLPAAMRSGAAIELPDSLPIDAQFVANIEQLQQIFARWFPGLTTVKVHGPIRPRTVTTVGAGTGYSGGVDSSYTLDVLADQVDSALLIDGIEYPDRALELSTSVAHELRAVMTTRDISLTHVVSNVKSVQRALGGYWSESLGGAIASCVHLAGFRSYHIAASNSWENLRPYGSHPLTDRLWSSASTTIEHHGAELRRVDKIRYLGGVPDLLAHIRVCFQGSSYNCGRCQKCLQTAAGFRALAIHTSSLPELSDARLLRTAMVEHAGDLVDWVELLVPGLAERDPDLFRELTRLIRRYRWRQVSRELDDLLTGGMVRRFHRRGHVPKHG